VAFRSDATNLVTGDTNATHDVFVHDRVSGATTCVSVNGSGTPGSGVSSAPRISGDGRYVSFTSGAANLVGGDTNGVQDIFVHDRVSGKTIRVSQSSAGTGANAYSHLSNLSFDGSSVVFQSSASNLVSGDANGALDIFVAPVVWGP
jgi:Tol biopolymer transport system component